MYIAGMSEAVNLYGSGYLRANRETVPRAREAFGVKVIEGDNSTGNRYYIDGKQVSREAAYMHAQKKLGVFL